MVLLPDMNQDFNHEHDFVLLVGVCIHMFVLPVSEANVSKTVPLLC